MISRREFVGFATFAMIGSTYSWAADALPPMLDHIILGCSDLNQGIGFVEQHTGIRAAIGGSHPNRGTRNALLSLGTRHYLEIMAPDPNAKNVEPGARLRLDELAKLATPRLVTWAIHTPDIDEAAKKLRKASIAANGPTPGSRVRPDGRVLKWKTLNLKDDHNGLLPFLIEWSLESLHPSSDAPAGCRLDRFAVADPDPVGLGKILTAMGVEMVVETTEVSRLSARISGPKGTLEASS